MIQTKKVEGGISAIENENILGTIYFTCENQIYIKEIDANEIITDFLARTVFNIARNRNIRYVGYHKNLKKAFIKNSYTDGASEVDILKVLSGKCKGHNNR